MIDSVSGILTPFEDLHCTPSQKRRASVMEAIAELHVDFPRIIEVESAKGEAVIEQHAPIRDVQSGQGHGVFLVERFASRNVKRGVLRQIGAGELGLGKW